MKYLYLPITYNCMLKLLTKLYFQSSFVSANNISIINADSMSSSRMSNPEKQRKKRTSRLIEIDKDVKITNDITASIITPNENDHLMAKKHIEDLREKYGADWLTKSDSDKIQEIKSNITENNFDEQTTLVYQSVEDIYYNIEGEALLSSTPINESNITNNSSFTSHSTLNISDRKSDENVPVLTDCEPLKEESIMDIYSESEDNTIGEFN